MKGKYKNIKKIFKYVIAPLLGAWLFYSLYEQIKAQPNLHQSLDLIKKAPYGENAWKFWSVIILIFFNWGSEARKWQILLTPIQKMNFFTAFKSVLTGVTLSINTPYRVGEYGGRILYVKKGSRIKAISLSMAGSISQLIITLFMGCLGLFLFIKFRLNDHHSMMGLSFFWLTTLLLISSLFTVLVILFFFKLAWLIKLIEKIPAAARIIPYINVLEEFTPKLLLRLLSLSLFRYAVFVIQYILLMQTLEVNMNWGDALLLINILFLVMAIVPSFAIADLGIRGKFSTELFSIYSANIVGIIGTTFGIWFINLFIPALVGSLVLLGSKFFKEK